MIDAVDLGGHSLAIGLTVATVSVLRKWMKLVGVQLVLAAFIAAVVLCLIVDLWLHAGASEPLHWKLLPLVVVISWLSAMGAWSGGKTISEHLKKKKG